MPLGFPALGSALIDPVLAILLEGRAISTLDFPSKRSRAEEKGVHRFRSRVSRASYLITPRALGLPPNGKRSASKVGFNKCGGYRCKDASRETTSLQERPR